MFLFPEHNIEEAELCDPVILPSPFHSYLLESANRPFLVATGQLSSELTLVKAPISRSGKRQRLHCAFAIASKAISVPQPSLPKSKNNSLLSTAGSTPPPLLKTELSACNWDAAVNRTLAAQKRNATSVAASIDQSFTVGLEWY